MQTGPLVMMIFILGTVWGGFGWLLWRSLQIDRQKRG